MEEVGKGRKGSGERKEGKWGEERREVGRGRKGSAQRKEGKWKGEGTEVGRGRKGSGKRKEGKWGKERREVGRGRKIMGRRRKERRALRTSTFPVHSTSFVPSPLQTRTDVLVPELLLSRFDPNSHGSTDYRALYSSH